MKQISIDQDIFDYLVSRMSTPGDSPAEVLRCELRVPRPQVALQIADETYAVIATRTAVIGESVSAILRRELNLRDDASPPVPQPAPPPPAPPPPAPAPPLSTVVVFRIPLGTGARSWNDGSSMVRATVGDTLRIINDDSGAHRLHTTGRPFPHPATDISPGQSADFVLQTTYDPDAEGPLVDHDQSPTSLFWIRVVARP